MSSLYYIKVKYDNFIFKAMIDCGAEISIISPSMLKILNLPYHKEDHGHVQGVGKAKLTGLCPSCLFTIVHQKAIPVRVNLYVMENQWSQNLVIFGLDFLEKYNCVIDCQPKMLNIKDCLVPLVQHRNRVIYKKQVVKK